MKYIPNPIVKNVSVKNRIITITLEAKIDDVFGEYNVLSQYEVKSEILRGVSKIAEEIIEESKGEIKKSILEGVDWAKITQNEVVKKTLREIVKENY